MIILGIETSCDETAAAVVSGENDNVEVLSNVVSSQIEIHKQYGGVVPEVAAREHVLSILPVIDQALIQAGIKRAEAGNKIDAISVTPGPGLITSLMTGVETARTLAFSWNIPLVAPNHIESHVYANFINVKNEIKFPAVVLTVSGGHTMLIIMTEHGKFETIGQTRDDAAGEAFDKTAKLLGLGYPGGPILSGKSQEFEKTGKEKTIKFPRPMINSADFDFSFSGLKTSVRYAIQKDENYKNNILEYCHEVEEAIVDVLISKTVKAALKYNAKTIMLAGGVSANKKLRENFERIVKEKIPAAILSIPDLRYTTDNAAMVAAAGYFRAKQKSFTPWQALKNNPNLEL